MNVLVKAALAVAALVAVGCTSGTAVSGAASGAGVSGAAVSGAAAAALRASVPACTAFGVRAIDQRQTVTQMPAACRGLSRAEINLALGRAIYLVAGSGLRKVAWHHRAAVEGARLARLITALAQSSPSAGPRSSAVGAPGSRPGPVDRRPLGLTALVAWLLTVASGGFMLGRFVAGGGLRHQLAAGDRTGPAVVLSHFFLASAGLLLWAGYLATSVLGVAWAAVALLLPVIGFGMGTLVLWTSGRSRRPARTSRAPSGTSETSSETSGVPAGTSPAAEPSAVVAEPSAVAAEPSAVAAEPSAVAARPSAVVAEPSPAGAPGQVRVAELHDQADAGRIALARRPSRWLTVIIPIGHGLLAMTTILLALLTVLGAT